MSRPRKPPKRFKPGDIVKDIDDLDRELATVTAEPSHYVVRQADLHPAHRRWAAGRSGLLSEGCLAPSSIPQTVEVN